jgi:hypothetical protein
MPEQRRAIQFDDSERNRLNATWSRSGKRLIVSVLPRGSWDRAAQVELEPEQVEGLLRFLDETVREPPAER